MADHQGMGVMIGMLGGNKETVETHNAAVGKVIAEALMEAESGRYRSMGENPGSTLVMRFTDGTGVRFYDDGQSCCEYRYMVCDDDLAAFSGAMFRGAEIREAPNEPDEYGDHEVQFLVVNTDRGAFTVASHNEHNGYYGGFWIVVRPMQPTEPTR